jgi:hypothetical protein
MLSISIPSNKNSLKKPEKKHIRFTDWNRAHAKCGSAGDTNNNHRCAWKPITIISEVCTWISLDSRTKEYSHSRNSTHLVEDTDTGLTWKCTHEAITWWNLKTRFDHGIWTENPVILCENKYITTITMIKILQLTWPTVSGTVYAVWELENLGHTRDTLPHQILFPLKIQMEKLW